MTEISLTVVAPVRRYHTYTDQWGAEIDAVLFFERELGEYDIIKGVRVSIRCFIASNVPQYVGVFNQLQKYRQEYICNVRACNVQFGTSFCK